LDVSSIGDIQTAKRPGPAGGLDSPDQGFEPLRASGAALNPSGDPDQVLIVYTTEPGSADETSLRLLANWHEGERHHSTIEA
jgi:hypothetical protein